MLNTVSLNVSWSAASQIYIFSRKRIIISAHFSFQIGKTKVVLSAAVQSWALYDSRDGTAARFEYDG